MPTIDVRDVRVDTAGAFEEYSHIVAAKRENR